jgi:hypothetical protein
MADAPKYLDRLESQFGTSLQDDETEALQSTFYVREDWKNNIAP